MSTLAGPVRLSKGESVSNREAEQCATGNVSRARWAFDVTPGREKTRGLAAPGAGVHERGTSNERLRDRSV